MKQEITINISQKKLHANGQPRSKEHLISLNIREEKIKATVKKLLHSIYNSHITSAKNRELLFINFSSTFVPF